MGTGRDPPAAGSLRWAGQAQRPGALGGGGGLRGGNGGSPQAEGHRVWGGGRGGGCLQAAQGGAAGHQVALLSADRGHRWPRPRAPSGARPQPGAQEGPSVGSTQDSESSTMLKWWRKSHSKLCFPREPIFLPFFSCARFYGARELLSQLCVREPQGGLRGIKRSAEPGRFGGPEKAILGGISSLLQGLSQGREWARLRSEPCLWFPGEKGHCQGCRAGSQHGS